MAVDMKESYAIPKPNAADFPPEILDTGAEDHQERVAGIASTSIASAGFPSRVSTKEMVFPPLHRDGDPPYQTISASRGLDARAGSLLWPSRRTRTEESLCAEAHLHPQEEKTEGPLRRTDTSPVIFQYDILAPIVSPSLKAAANGVDIHIPGRCGGIGLNITDRTICGRARRRFLLPAVGSPAGFGSPDSLRELVRDGGSDSTKLVPLYRRVFLRQAQP